MKCNQNGFTLIELLVVIAIIGLLASVVLASLSSARAKARDARRLADLQSIRTTLEFYVSQNNVYPGSPTTYYWISDNNYSEGLPCSNTIGLKPWLPTICSLNDPLGYPYAYIIKTDGTYNLGARFELSDHRGAPFNMPCCGVLSNYYEPK